MLHAGLLDGKRSGQNGPALPPIWADEGKMGQAARKMDLWPKNHSKGDRDDRRSIFGAAMVEQNLLKKMSSG